MAGKKSNLSTLTLSLIICFLCWELFDGLDDENSSLRCDLVDAHKMGYLDPNSIILFSFLVGPCTTVFVMNLGGACKI